MHEGELLDRRFRLAEPLGHGGGGTVYAARDEKTGARVAVKVLHTGDDLTTLIRFRREVLATSRLEHPAIVKVHHFSVDGEVPYIAMELLEGESLRAKLTREGTLPLARAVRVARQILGGLVAAHQAGVIHRDLKPENVIVLSGHFPELVKIVDFGLAKLTDGDPFRMRTKAGHGVGTPAYMAPEQIVGGSVDARTDVFAVGVTLFEMLTGELPFSSPEAQLARAVANKAPDRVAILHGRVPLDLEALIERILAPRLEDRPASAVVLFDALAPFDVDATAVRDTASSVTTEVHAASVAPPASDSPRPPDGAVIAAPRARARGANPPRRAQRRRRAVLLFALAMSFTVGGVGLGVAAFVQWRASAGAVGSVAPNASPPGVVVDGAPDPPALSTALLTAALDAAGPTPAARHGGVDPRRGRVDVTSALVDSSALLASRRVRLHGCFVKPMSGPCTPAATDKEAHWRPTFWLDVSATVTETNRLADVREGQSFVCAEERGIAACLAQQLAGAEVAPRGDLPGDRRVTVYVYFTYP